jgi:hypothetical protein
LLGYLFHAAGKLLAGINDGLNHAVVDSKQGFGSTGMIPVLDGVGHLSAGNSGG